MIDADMIMRSPFFPKQLGVSSGMSSPLCFVGTLLSYSYHQNLANDVMVL